MSGNRDNLGAQPEPTNILLHAALKSALMSASSGDYVIQGLLRRLHEATDWLVRVQIGEMIVTRCMLVKIPQYKTATVTQ